MIFGTCQKCNSTKLPVKNGQLVPHLSKGKPCDWGIPSNITEGIDLPYLTNPSMDFFQNISTMLDLLEGM
jgi:hypothetical protein